MRIRYISDLHIDINRGLKSIPLFSEKMRKDIAKDDVLVVAGDVVNDTKHPRFEAFLKECSLLWKKVVFVAGNHDYAIGKSMQETDKHLAMLCKQYDIAYLNKSVEMIDGVPFIGCTLWSDLKREAYVQLWNNFLDSKIRIEDPNGTRKIRYEDYVGLHQDQKKWLIDALKKYEAFPQRVVITHHAPTYIDASHPKYKNGISNSFFMNDMDALLGDMPDERKGLWIFGHTHWNTLQDRGSWIVTSNCVGYAVNNEDVGYRDAGPIDF